MKLQVAFGLDPTGFEKDIVETVEIAVETCLFCSHDSRLGIHRLHKEVKDALELKGYDLDYHFHLLKVYVA